jgi:hypothetical protein
MGHKEEKKEIIRKETQIIKTKIKNKIEKERKRDTIKVEEEDESKQTVCWISLQTAVFPCLLANAAGQWSS